MKVFFSILLLTISYITTSYAVEQTKQTPLPMEDYEKCLLALMDTAKDTVTVAEIKAQCANKAELVFYKPSQEILTEKPNPSSTPKKNAITEEAAEDSDLVKQRLRDEYRTSQNRFAILPHKSNYLLPFSFNSRPNSHGFDLASQERNMDNTEVKFQVSFKTPIWAKPFGDNSALFFAYTGQSYWQAYNADVSSPFRETNHEPEIFAAWATDWKLNGWQIPAFSLGIAHQSNGRSGLNSRSWNRVYTEWVIEKNNFVVALKPWWRIPEKQKETPMDPKGDDNPDMDDYMGYFELQTRYQWQDQHFGITVRNNLRTDNKGAYQLDWTFPLGGKNKSRGYVQYFYGYGESLIDYNKITNRLGFGFVLTGWL